MNKTYEHLNISSINSESDLYKKDRPRSSSNNQYDKKSQY